MNQDDSLVTDQEARLNQLSPLTVTERELCCALAPLLPTAKWLVIGPTTWTIVDGAAQPTPFWPLPTTATPLGVALATDGADNLDGFWMPLASHGRTVGGLILLSDTSISASLINQLALLVEGIYVRRMAIRQVIWQHLLAQINVRYAAGEERFALLSEVLSRSLGLVPQAMTKAQVTIPYTFAHQGEQYGRSRPFWPDEVHFIELALAIAHPAITRSRVLGLAATGVAHDLNNLLTVILGRAQLLELDAIDEQISDLQMIETAAEISAGSARRLQRFAQLNHIAAHPVDMATVAFAAVAMARRALAQPDHVQVVVNLPVLPSVAGDESLLHTALTGLIVSAAQELPAGSIITVSGGADGDNTWIEVIDPTLPPTTDLRALSGQTRRAHTLELAIARQVARVHHGHLRIDPDPSGGTRVQLIIPRWKQENGRGYAGLETSQP